MDDMHEVDELPTMPRKEIAPADRELLALAAHALGARFEEVDGEDYGNLYFADGSIMHAWNSLQFSGDAFDLAATLDIDVIHAATYREARAVAPRSAVAMEPWGDDKLAATRRAITRVAGDIGKQHS